MPGELTKELRYIDDLARKNSEALSFIPRPRLEQYLGEGRVMFAYENDEPAGFLLHGAGWPNLRIYQACIQYDARRRELGLGLVERLAEAARGSDYSALRLWCANDLDANAFWRAAGFYPVAERAGGQRRGRRHTLWLRELAPDLFTPIAGRQALAEGPGQS